MFVLRSIKASDLKQVHQLARMLNAINLSTRQEELEQQIQISMKSFSGELKRPDSKFIFCLEDTKTKKIIGSSMIIAQHGTKESPHFYFDVKKIEKYSESIHSGIVHQILRLGYDYDGPTELGGLILHPAFRGSGKHLGKTISWGRLMYIAMHRRKFKDRVITEFLPPLTHDGKSELWESLGRNFTNLPYLEADRISRKNKEFIFSLFPKQAIYTCLLTARARSLIGLVGDDSKPAQSMLSKAGLKFLNMIDPFDGGPHYGAKTKDIIAIKKTKKIKIKKSTARKYDGEALIAKEYSSEFKAVVSEFKIEGKRIILPNETKEVLEVEAGDTIHQLPLKF